MKAILVDENKNLVWSDVADPVIKDDEVLVKIYAAALNRADLLQRQGKYPSPAGCPEWMGLEIAGVITAAGKAVTDWKTGDRVCALLGGGGYAEYVAVKYDMLMPIPKGLSMVEAAALPEAYATSYLNLFIEGHLKAGQTAFIPAGASGLASVAIPMAKAFGARVITSVLSDEIAINKAPWRGSDHQFKDAVRGGDLKSRGGERHSRGGFDGLSFGRDAWKEPALYGKRRLLDCYFHSCGN